MTEFEAYRAVADADRAKALANTASPFSIKVRFLGGLREAQKRAFKAAADRWCRIIVGDIPTFKADGEMIDDVLILARGAPIDGRGGILAQAGPTVLRPVTAEAAAFLPAKGRMTFDVADLSDMEANGTLNDVVTHEMGHVLGFGSIWDRKHLIDGAGTTNPTFIGPAAMKEYGALCGTPPTAVPIENAGQPGTRDSHWRKSVFESELMSTHVVSPGKALSRLTVASLQDLGYTVDFGAAEPYGFRTCAPMGPLPAPPPPTEGLEP